MSLPPEAQRLRRIAKAHAAGEFTRAEYRQARRVLIEELAAGAMSSPLEETYRRSANTARRTLDERFSDALVVSRGAQQSPARRQGGLLWFVLGTGLLIALMGVAPHLQG